MGSFRRRPLLVLAVVAPLLSYAGASWATSFVRQNAEVLAIELQTVTVDGVDEPDLAPWRGAGQVSIESRHPRQRSPMMMFAVRGEERRLNGSRGYVAK